MVQLFDREQREQVSASVRGNIGNLNGEPVFRAPVRAAADGPCGEAEARDRLGFAAYCRVRVLDGDGRPVASGKGSGTLWTTPEVDWKPGEYTIELAASGATLRQSLQFLPPDKGPELPTELGRSGSPRVPPRGCGRHMVRGGGSGVPARGASARGAGSGFVTARPAADARLHRRQAPVASAVGRARRGQGPSRPRRRTRRFGCGADSLRENRAGKAQFSAGRDASPCEISGPPRNARLRKRLRQHSEGTRLLRFEGVRP